MTNGTSGAFGFTFLNRTSSAASRPSASGHAPDWTSAVRLSINWRPHWSRSDGVAAAWLSPERTSLRRAW